ncbi:LytR/AlgR family response regulator transcription factor [Dinghuibacter silviterrae]|uniref:LytTR family two component transcriptional regulator n=1 Tax=Dinghuibacter silviterrae TaxID=1539049 RepID=A0A4R8DF32_9BACT|nr:LytTR family DNA-binding domain-containing protein [Dinghuibacter silviterrae]TDW95676.1 LytTR family two component transcriptional regulator [Dinghuibacter silviterrae]
MIRAVIVDDEPGNVQNLVQLLERHCPEVAVSGTAYDAAHGKTVILEQRPDLVFLDISMPGESGLDLLKSLPAPEFDVIFVTAFHQYGIQAIKLSALDYLLKPINIQELRHAVSKALAKNDGRRQQALLENLVHLLQDRQQMESHRIALPGAKETRLVQPSRIIRCEASNNYTTFFLQGNEKIVVSKPIFEYEELLGGYGFIRCHQSHLVNKAHIRSWIKEDGGYLLLEDNTAIPVSRQKRDLIRSIMAPK